MALIMKLTRFRMLPFFLFFVFAFLGPLIGAASAESSKEGPQLPWTWTLHLPDDGEILAIAFSTDGTKFISAGSKGAVRTFDSHTRKEIGKSIRVGFYSTAIALSHGLRVAFSRRADDYDWRDIHIWDLNTQKELKVWTGHRANDFVSTLSFDGSGRLLLSGGDRGTVYLWDADRGKRLRVLSAGGSCVTKVVLSDQGTWAAAGRRNGIIDIWNTKTWKRMRIKQTKSQAIGDLKFSKHGEFLFSGSGSFLTLWRVKDSHLVQQIETDGDVLSVALSSSEESVAVAGRTVRFYNVNTGDESLNLGPISKPSMITLSPGNEFLLHAYGFALSLWSQ